MPFLLSCEGIPEAMDALAVKHADVSRESSWRLGWSLRGDDKLIKLYRAGDYNAFVILYSRYHALVFSNCLGVLGSREDAEDAAQEVMLTLAKKLKSEEPHNLKAWISQVARNEAIDYFRARKKTYELPVGFESTRIVDDAPAVLGRRDEVDSLLSSLKQLSEKQRSALVLKEIAGSSCNEIAVVLDTTPGRVKDLLRTGRLALRAQREASDLTCERVQSIIASETDWRSAPREVRVHVRECTECKKFKEQIRQDRYLLRGMVPVAGMPLLWKLTYSYSGARSRFGETLNGLLLHDHVSAVATVGAVAVIGGVAVVGINSDGGKSGSPAPKESAEVALAQTAEAATAPSGNVNTLGSFTLGGDAATPAVTSFAYSSLVAPGSEVGAQEVTPSDVASASAKSTSLSKGISADRLGENESPSSGAVESSSSYSSSGTAAPVSNEVTSRSTLPRRDGGSSSPTRTPTSRAPHAIPQTLSSGGSSDVSGVQEVSAPPSSGPTENSTSNSSDSSAPTESSSQVSPTRPSAGSRPPRNPHRRPPRVPRPVTP